MVARLDTRFKVAAQGNPDGVAVEDPERGTSLRYRELEALSASIARTLVDAGVGPADRVGICAPKSIGTVAAVLGIMESGAAYVPVDSTAPPARNAFIFQDCSVSAVVADPALAGGLAEEAGSGFEVIGPLDGLAGVGVDLVLLRGVEPDGPGTTVPPDDLAYILYTSGSTGRPKGVMHTHASALAFVDWCKETFEVFPSDRFSSHAPFHFDLSIHDLYVPLTSGACLVLVSEGAGKTPLKLGHLIRDRRITVWYSTPSILRLLSEFGQMEAGDFDSLRVVHFAGEVFPLKHLRAIKSIWTRPRFFNLYGPTETNVCTYLDIPEVIPPDRTEPYPIGYPCSGDLCRVVDSEGLDVPAGEEGELLVSGPSVMVGYWNLPDRDATAFTDDGPPGRWYRTGDLVRDTGGECFDFLGRRDRMVKRRGYRVELGEIESALYRHPEVSEAAVVATSDAEGDVRVKAFLIWIGEGKPSMVKMKMFCAKELPGYMIPDTFSFLESLPKTSTHKIDYQRLLAEES